MGLWNATPDRLAWDIGTLPWAGGLEDDPLQMVDSQGPPTS